MKYNVKITSKNPSNSKPIIALEWVTRAMDGKGAYGECIISEGGVYKLLPYIPSAKIPEQAKDREKIVKIDLSSVQSSGSLSLWSTEFTWYDTAEEAERNGSSKVENSNIQTVIEALKRHPEISVKDENNKEVNKNVDPVLLKYNFIDTTERIKKNTDKQIYTIEATSQIYNWFKNEPQKLIQFGYLWGYKGIKSQMTTQELSMLFNYLVAQVSENLDKYRKVNDFIQSDIHVHIITATRLAKNGQFIIKKEGNFFVFNGNAIAEGDIIENCIEAAVAYFSSNSQDYMLLKNEIGVKSDVPQVSILEEEIKESSGLGIKSLNSLNKNPHAQKEQDKLKSKFARYIYRIVVEGKDITADKDGNAYRTLEATGRTVDESLKELSELAEIRDNVALQEFFQQEVNRVKEERTPLVR